jgi:hypothetical protein
MPLKITRCPENPIVWPGKTAIGLATVPLNDLVDHIFATSGQ